MADSKTTAARSTVPPFEALDEKKLRALGKKLDKLEDPNGYKHTKLLQKESQRPYDLLWHLVRHGLACVDTRSTGILYLLAHSTQTGAADDVLALLANLPDDLSGFDPEYQKQASFTPGLPRNLDTLLMRAVIDDRAKVRAALEVTTKPHHRRALYLVLARAGEPTPPDVAVEILQDLAIGQATPYGLASNAELLYVVDGQVQKTRPETPADVRALALRFGDEATWRRVLLEQVRKAEVCGAQAVGDALDIAPFDFLLTFFAGNGAHKDFLAALDRRSDPPEVLREHALKWGAVEPEPARQNGEMMATLAIERTVARGEAPPPDLAAAFHGIWVSGEEDVPFATRIRAALAQLPAPVVHARVRALASQPHYRDRALAFADLHFDPSVVNEVFDALDAAPHGISDRASFITDPRAAPLMIERLRSANAKVRPGYVSMLLRLAGRATSPVPPETFNALPLDAPWGLYASTLTPLMRAALAAQPANVAEAYLRRLAAEDPPHAWRAFALAPPHVSSAVMTELTRAALASGFKDAQFAHVVETRNQLGAGRVALFASAMPASPPPSTWAFLNNLLPHDEYAALETARTVPSETPDQVLVRLAAALTGEKMRVYLLVRGEGAPKGYSRIGGDAPGGAPPSFEQEPMEHLLTLDLDEVPELRAHHPDARAVSIFLPALGDAENHESGVVEWRAPTAKAPSGTALRVVPLEVPAEVFGAGPLAPEVQAVRDALLRAPGFVGGGPLWIQDADFDASLDFLLQCDNALVPEVNLGDTGVLYVFESSIVWQSH